MKQIKPSFKSKGPIFPDNMWQNASQLPRAIGIGYNFVTLQKLSAEAQAETRFPWSMGSRGILKKIKRRTY
jgi:hypothetical protein